MANQIKNDDDDLYPIDDYSKDFVPPPPPIDDDDDEEIIDILNLLSILSLEINGVEIASIIGSNKKDNQKAISMMENEYINSGSEFLKNKKSILLNNLGCAYAWLDSTNPGFGIKKAMEFLEEAKGNKPKSGTKMARINLKILKTYTKFNLSP